jgi:serine/threonine protein kinase
MEPIKPGTWLGSHEIQDFIGAGGMGEVYRARDSKLKRDVAIKVCPQPLQANRTASRANREAQVVAALNIPISQRLRSRTIRFNEILVLEFVEGETLAERLAATCSV